MIASVCLEHGFGAAKKAFHDVWSRVIDSVSLGESDLPVGDYVSRLQRELQGKFRKEPFEFRYRVLSNKTLADNTQVFEVVCVLNGAEIGRGTGSSKKKARQKAAEVALKSGLLNSDGT